MLSYGLPWYPPYKTTSSSGSANGRGRRSVELTMLKIAELAPMPAASEIAAMKLRPFDCQRDRAPYRRSYRKDSIGAPTRFGESSLRTSVCRSSDDVYSSRSASQWNL